jgi:hypothetical protein
MPEGTITKIVNLRRPRHYENKSPQHHSIVIYINNIEHANKCINHGFYINYQHHKAERFYPQTQLALCYNCNSYGHQAATCKMSHPRCGRCSNEHNTGECKSIEAHCVNCHQNHEAWHPKCPARVKEKQQRIALMADLPTMFNISIEGVEHQEGREEGR